MERLEYFSSEKIRWQSVFFLTSLLIMCMRPAQCVYENENEKRVLSCLSVNLLSRSMNNIE